MIPRFSFVTSGGLGASPQVYHERGSVIYCVLSTIPCLILGGRSDKEVGGKRIG